MCGIAGFYNFSNLNPAESLKRMCNAISHRGPDDEGYYHDDLVGLGMRRLSIIDINGGQQPMSSSQGSQHLVFNGEIYNYRQLRSQLLKQGACFSSSSDTEVIIRSFENAGADMLQTFNGMFGIAIWDRQKKRLFLARDRMGIKPLYYYWDGSKFAFASEIKAILALPQIKREINQQAISDYLTFRYVPQPQTIWKHIYKLPPAHFLAIGKDFGEPCIERYWNYDFSDTDFSKDPEQCASEFEDLLLDSIESRLIADVPVGILLSGGLDSAAITAGAKERHSGELNTFSVAFDEGAQYNELAHAREVASHLSTQHHEVVIGEKEFMDFLPEFVRFADEPLADPASIPLYYVAKLASNTVKVVLSGEGADEILGGYNLDKTMAKHQLLRRIHQLPEWLRNSFPSKIATASGNKKLLNAVRKANLPLGLRNSILGASMTNYFNNPDKTHLLDSTESCLDAKRNLEQLYSDAGTDDFLHQLLYVHQQDWLVEDLLMKADKMTMANSLELRVPFLDHRLVEWTSRTPSVTKVGKMAGTYRTKLPLRNFATGRIPASIIERPKQGFPVPTNRFMFSGQWQLARDLLQSSDSHTQDLFDKTFVEHLITDATSNKATDIDNKAGDKIWLLIILEYWMREWQPHS